MSDKKIKKILVVGAGSAGWMSASFLNKAFNGSGQTVEITLVESSDIDTVGVGEATIPLIQGFFSFLGIPEENWMKACKATFKLGIKFEGWYDNGPNDSYWHTFANHTGNRGPSIDLSQNWLYEHLNQLTDLSFSKYMHEAVYACESKKTPKPAFSPNGRMAPINYAYHLDAGLLSKMLRNYSKANGVNHIIGTVNQVNKDERGYITTLRTEDGQSLEADLFIDCTGFSARLIDQALNEEYESYSDYLICDRAIAIGTMYPEDDPYNELKGGLNTFTTAKAYDAGWAWHTPLVSRDGNGYVYSSNHKTSDQAEEEFVKMIGSRGELKEANHIKIKTGKYKNTWSKNCVSIGLSSGFIEPMESTGIAMIHIGLKNLIQYFPDKTFPTYLSKKYNEEMTHMYENIRDFICLHYTLTNREDTSFWKDIKYNVPVPDSLATKLEEWKEFWDTQRDRLGMFGPFNHFSILAGMNYLPQLPLPISGDYQKDLTQNRKNTIVARGTSAASKLPTQAQYFKQLSRIKQFQEERF